MHSSLMHTARIATDVRLSTAVDTCESSDMLDRNSEGAGAMDLRCTTNRVSTGQMPAADASACLSFATLQRL